MKLELFHIYFLHLLLFPVVDIVLSWLILAVTLLSELSWDHLLRSWVLFVNISNCTQVFLCNLVDSPWPPLAWWVTFIKSQRPTELNWTAAEWTAKVGTGPLCHCMFHVGRPLIPPCLHTNRKINQESDVRFNFHAINKIICSSSDTQTVHKWQMIWEHVSALQ